MEVDVRRGLPTFTLVGLPDRAIRESRERVRAALLNSGLDFPQQRLTVNLAPAHVRKAGPSFDLAIAVGVLAASGQVPAASLEFSALCGELSLSGELRPIRGALATALGARKAGYRRLLVPTGNAAEAALAREAALPGRMEICGIPTLERLAEMLHGRWTPEIARPAPPNGARPPRGPRPDRRARSGGREAGARDHRRGWPQPVADRTAGRRKDDAGAASARHPAAAELRGGSRDHPGPRRGRNRQRPARHRAPVSGPAPHHLRPGARRGRRAPDAGRDHPGSPRRPLSGRAAGVRPWSVGRPPSATRGGAGGDHARTADDRLPRERDRRRRLQPLPLRAPTGPLLLHGPGAGALPEAAQRAPRRPHRPHLRGRGAAASRTGRDRGGAACRLRRVPASG